MGLQNASPNFIGIPQIQSLAPRQCWGRDALKLTAHTGLFFHTDKQTFDCFYGLSLGKARKYLMRAKTPERNDYSANCCHKQLHPNMLWFRLSKASESQTLKDWRVSFEQIILHYTTPCQANLFIYIALVPYACPQGTSSLDSSYLRLDFLVVISESSDISEVAASHHLVWMWQITVRTHSFDVSRVS